MSESADTTEGSDGEVKVAPAQVDSTTEKPPGEKIVLPDDIADDERRDFERTGTLELYELRREADKAAREKIKLRQELSDAAKAEEQKRVLRQQLAEASEVEKPKLVLPPDATEDERKDFERTGTLELYDLQRNADKIQRERIALRKELADKVQMDAHKRALRAQAEMDRLTLENERKALSAPPARDPYEDSKPIPGSERLPDVVKGVLRRLFGYGSGEWTEANQIGLVNLLLAMGNHKAQSWAFEMRDALAGDVYHSHDLSPSSILKGSTGLKAIAGPALMGELKALAGGDPALKALADGGPRRKKKPKKKGRRDGVVEVEATRVREERSVEADDIDSDEDVIDDSPNQDSESVHDPWGEFN